MGLPRKELVREGIVLQRNRAVFPRREEASAHGNLERKSGPDLPHCGIDRNQTLLRGIALESRLEMKNLRLRPNLNRAGNRIRQEIIAQAVKGDADGVRTEDQRCEALGFEIGIQIESLDVVDQRLENLAAQFIISRRNAAHVPLVAGRPRSGQRHEPGRAQRGCDSSPFRRTVAGLAGGPVLIIRGVAVREQDVAAFVETAHAAGSPVEHDARMPRVQLAKQFINLPVPAGIVVPVFRFVGQIISEQSGIVPDGRDEFFQIVTLFRGKAAIAFLFGK
ncbi:MAG: hypothetical protein BWY31_02913 [Lentisphaerae bacterium ADurb.Bin242]|nr:MAG: hypothetical protein BWY31_02913 [Lentisphaerae bacterium ADurb.Bin242]